MARFVHETTYQCLSQLKKKLKETQYAHASKIIKNQISLKHLSLANELQQHSGNPIYNSQYLKNESPSQRHALETSRSKIVIPNDHDIQRYLQVQRVKNDQLNQSHSQSVGIEATDILPSLPMEGVKQRQIMQNVQSELSDDISMNI